MERKFVNLKNVEITFNASTGYDSGYGTQYFVNVLISDEMADNFTAEGLKVWEGKAGKQATIKTGKKLLEHIPDFGVINKGSIVTLKCYIDEYRGHKYIKAYDADELNTTRFEPKAKAEEWGTELPF